MRNVSIVGGGPAGAAAAIAAVREGARVVLAEKSKFPRHKVCGEFLSPEIAQTLEQLGVFTRFVEARPAVIRRLALHFRSAEKNCKLPESAYGLSRYAFDHLLLNEALRAGAQVQTAASDEPGSPLVIAHGRKEAVPKGDRLFGFKSHFDGPANDAVELFFFSGCYVGVNPVEGGVTNVCGIGPEAALKAKAFEIDELVNAFPPLAERLRPLSRRMKWLTVGPLVFRNGFDKRLPDGRYPAGDALSFVDPFTGTGMLSAVTTGRLAGIAAANATPTAEYLRQCRCRLQRPFQVSSLLRSAVGAGWAERLVGYVPGAWLVRLTRPRAG